MILSQAGQSNQWGGPFTWGKDVGGHEVPGTAADWSGFNDHSQDWWRTSLGGILDQQTYKDLAAHRDMVKGTDQNGGISDGCCKSN